MRGFVFDVAHLLAGGLVLVSFMQLYQDRLSALAQRLRPARDGAGAVGRVAGIHPGRAPPLRDGSARAGFQGASSSRWRCAGSLCASASTARSRRWWAWHDHAVRHGLVALSMVVMLRVTRRGRPAGAGRPAFALSVVLLGLLMMVTRRNAVSQVVGFMSLENGLVLAATGAKGMPLVVEISVAFSILIAFIVIGIFLFRIRERFDTIDVRRSTASGESGDDHAVRRRDRGPRSFRPALRRCSRRCLATGSPRGSMCSRRCSRF